MAKYVKIPCFSLFNREFGAQPSETGSLLTVRTASQSAHTLSAPPWPRGGFGASARTLEEIGPAVQDALASNKPAIAQVPVRAVLSPYRDVVTR